MAADTNNSFMLQYTVEKSLGESLNLVRNKAGHLKVVKKCKMHVMESTVVSLDTVVDNLRHSCIVDIDASFVVSGSVYLISAYCEGGSLSALIKRARAYDEILNEAEVADWLIHITLALQHLHSKGLVYGHLNPKNIMLSNNSAKLSSVKLLFWELEKLERARTADGDCHTSSVTMCNAASFLSPRLLTASSDCLLPSPADDMWALGCCLYEMCSRTKLFSVRNSQKISIEDRTLPQFPDQFSAELAEVWHRLMEKDETKRPSATELLEMNYLMLHRQSADAGLTSCPENANHCTPELSCSEQHRTDDHEFTASSGEELDDDDMFFTADDINELLTSPST